jgi:outer membrane protein assembly factor BamB
MRALVMVLCLLPLLAVAADWPQWRGLRRDGISAEVPLKLPAKQLLWRKPLGGETHAGVVAAGDFVVVPDHEPDKDVFHCYRVDSGDVVWTHTMDNPNAEMPFGAATRATPCIAGGKVYLLNALGDLDCLQLDTGAVVWHRNLVKDYGAELPMYGYCASPLIVDGKLIVAPGAKEASLLALDPDAGHTLWSTPGEPAAYASFITGTFGGKVQIVGYDQAGLGGWDLATGTRLWSLKPEVEGDFNVGTPLAINGKLLVSTENNYTRFFTFDATGKLTPKPAATNDTFGPDSATPVFLNGRLYGTHFGLHCLDVTKGLKTLWKNEKNDHFNPYASLIAGNNRVMLFTESGFLYLLADGPTCQVLGSYQVCHKTWSHPALANGRLFIRDEKWVYCYAMK